MERKSAPAQPEQPATQAAQPRQTRPKASAKPAQKPQPASPASAPQQATPAPASAAAASQWERGAPDPDYSATEDVFTLTDPFPEYSELDAFNQAIQGCQKCPLGATRQNFVFGVGDPNADLVLVGEAPGAEEDKIGQPFVGRAGKLLDQILAAVDLKRGDGVYICNILKCRPPNNRDPLPSEVHECEPHLLKQLQLLQPKLIVALGRIAAQTLLRTNESLTKLREQDLVYHGIPLIVTYHPAALLRNPNWKRPTWEDVQKMKRMLDEARGN
ncbi:uracil-DNA glycosylase [bacterium]|nr:uracil-DNA glycosylase [bacterium]